jgi:hypothetical protein
MRDRELFEREIDTLLLPTQASVAHEITADFKEQVSTGTTLYADLKVDRLRFPLAAKFTPEFKQVGLYATTNAKPNAAIDVFLFLHGHVTECGITEKVFQRDGIQCLWNQKAFVALRRDLEKSGRTAMLIVPKMDALLGKRRGAAGWLHLEKRDVIRALIAAAWEALQAAGALDKKAETGRKYLAGIGAAGEPMQKIIGSRDGSMFEGCIGFETVGPSAEVWRVWGSCSGRMFFDHYRTKGWNEKLIAAEYKGSIFDTVGTGKRCDLVEQFWARAVGRTKASFIDPIQPWMKDKTEHEFQYDNPQDVPQRPATPTYTLQTLQPLITPTKLAERGSKSRYDRYHRAHPTAAPSAHPAYVRVHQAPDIWMRNIIRDARERARTARDAASVAILDPDTYFTQFTRIKFLGVAFNTNQYVHVELAKKLQEIESALITQIGGTAASVGRTLLNNRNETHAASRFESATADYSMHMFGLAIDINAMGDPYIRDSALGAFNTALRNASRLLRAADARTYSHGGGAAQYDVLAPLDTLLQQYFALVADPAALRAATAASRDAIWRARNEADARAAIQADIDALAGKVNRTGNLTKFKARAVLDFDRRLVEAMDTAGMTWGAEYGDIMHFDLRRRGIGRYIQAARVAHKGRAEQQRDQHFRQRNYGYHVFVD